MLELDAPPTAPFCNESTAPLSPTAYQRPPTKGSMMDLLTGSEPRLCVRGHQRSMPLVKTSNARAGDASTVMLLRTGAILIARVMVYSFCVRWPLGAVVGSTSGASASRLKASSA